MKKIMKMILASCIILGLLFTTKPLYEENVETQDEYQMLMYDYQQEAVKNVTVSNTEIKERPASLKINDMPSTAIIIGEDEQQRVTKQYPYSAVMFLGIRYSNGTVTTGTGVLVGPDIMLTAGHVFYHEKFGKAIEVRTYPAMMTEYKTFPKTLDSISGEWCYPKSWFCGRISLDVSSYNNENDWSVVKLAKRYGDTYGYWGYKANVYDTKSVNVVGYPINLTKTFFPYLSSGSVVYDQNTQDPSKSVIKYLADTEAGNSGSPVFCYYDGSPTVIATHISGYADAISPTKFNIGRIVNNGIVNCIQYYYTH